MGYDTLIQGAHVARNILMTLSGRPISVSNTAYVVSSLRSLHSIASEVGAISGGINPYYLEDCRRFSQLLHETVGQPTAPRLAGMRHYIENDLPIYSQLRQMPYEFDPCPPRPFRGRSYSRMLVMIGPGIGIGDEVSYTAFFRALADHFRIRPERTEIFTFSPGLWQTLAPEFVRRNLSGAPLAFFHRLRHVLKTTPPGKVLIVYASFMGQEMHRCLLPYRDRLDIMEVGLASGQAWLKLRGQEHGVTHRGRDQKTPNMIRALEELLAHLLGDRPRIASRSTVSYQAGSEKVFRIFVNPFTSKFSPLTPEHWAQFIRDVRAALPRRMLLSCRVSPGLAPWCRDYAREIVRHTRRLVPENIMLSILGESDGVTLNTENGIREMHRALARADFVLAIDTYTAHLAAYLNTVSLALCLNRNPEFWQPAVHTFWVDINVGGKAVSTMTRAIVKLVTRNFTDDPAIHRYAAECRHLVGLGHPLELPDGSGSAERIRAWVAQAQRVWDALPSPLAGILDSIDADHSWMRVKSNVTGSAADQRRIALAKLAESSFFRFACLAVGEACTRRAAA
jgi:hypothetical protein